MRGLASFVMRGRSQAVMVATVTAMLSLLVPLLSVLSTAVVGLVSLRRGVQDGVLLIGLSVLATALVASLSIGQPFAVVVLVLMIWLPIFAIATVLRVTRSLDLAVLLALGFGVLLVGADYLRVGDTAEFWAGMLEPLRTQFVESQLLNETQSQAFIQQMARWMTGVLATGFFLQLVFGLLLARWWQALLYNPGGFQAEFHGLRLNRVLAYLSLPLIGLMLMQGEETPAPIRHGVLLLVAAFFLQGLAVVHNALARTKANPLWLIGLYVLLVLAMPHAEILLALVGLTDTWIDFRARVRDKRGPGVNEE